jgi:hypothetical protein
VFGVWQVGFVGEGSAASNVTFAKGSPGCANDRDFAIVRALYCIFRMCYVREGCSFMAETGTVKEEAPVSNLRLYEQLELNKAKKEEGSRVLLALLHRFSVSCFTAFQQSFKKNTRRTLHLHQVCPSCTGMLCISFIA